jgi:pimeloyl-ACP methyl ester carboxylesterase
MKKLSKHISSLRTALKVRKLQKQINIPTMLFLGRYDKTFDVKHTLNGFNRYFKDKPTLFEHFIFDESGHLCFEEEPKLFIDKFLDYIKK